MVIDCRSHSLRTLACIEFLGQMNTLPKIAG